MNGQPFCDIKNCPSTQESCDPAYEEDGHGSVLGLVGYSILKLCDVGVKKIFGVTKNLE